MRDRIRTLRFLFSKGDPEPLHHVSVVTPAGYHTPRTVDTLCRSPLRKTCLLQIWENSSLPADVYHRLYITPLHGLLARVQNVPATQQGRWSQSDGFGDLTLQFTTCAVRLAKGYMFPPGAAPEEQAEQNVMWNTVIFWSALFWHLPLLASLEGELLDGKSWLPGITVPDSPYRFRFREADNSSAFAALAAGQLMPAEATGWLAENPEALGNLAGSLWNQHPAMPLIRSLMKQAAEKVESPSLEVSGANEKVNTLIEPALSVPQTPSDQEIELEPSVETTLKTTSPEAADLQGIQLASSIAPVPMADGSNLVSNEKAGESTECDPNETEKADTEMLLSLFSAIEEPDMTGTEACDEESSISTRTENEPEFPPLNELLPDADKPEINQTVAEDSFLEHAVEDNIPLHSINIDAQKTVIKKQTGTEFLRWLSEGLKSKRIDINQPHSRAHAVAGLIFLRVPDIFYLYIRESGAELSRDTIQMEFEKLHIHKVRRGERFIKAKLYHSPGKEGTFKPVSGYLVKTTHLFRGASSPEDSGLLSFL
ncbi:TraI domain-containing protein [Salmonella enterica]|nr:TraI domain-containing protein [Salmonella enterica]EKZ1412059.1 TraI domain-containing protein [Salmonella enterica]ELK9560884.1 TraI domain-containing protein [Salmonella enterica]ELK9564253.1 TraI domain-containing protein [Salmonella enterica]ELM1265511.1 TraI domain-containing protein [Salmonella enterica]